MNRTHLIVSISGVLMAVALALGRLTRPEVIIGSVDFFGHWDPTMLIFFAFGVTAYHVMWRWARGREEARRGPTLRMPAARVIDKRLIVGAAIFGVGWGLGGVCPGPGFTSLGAGASWALPFLAALVLGFSLVPDAPTERGLAPSQPTRAPSA